MEESPAWMVSEDLVSRISGELMSEALDLLEEEIKAGRVRVEGNLVTAAELTSEAEKHLFILDRLLGDEQNMRHRYENLVQAVEEGKESNPDVVARLEEVKKFLLVVSQISITVKYAKVFTGWFLDAGKNMRIADPSEIIYMTALGNPERKEALDFILTNKTFIKSEVLKDGELEIVKRAYTRL
jgi:hypothetical protein